MASEKSERRKADAVVKSSVVMRAYRLGFKEGEIQRQMFVNTLKHSNNYLWNILCELDEEQPLEGVTISFKFAGRLIEALQSSGKEKYARDLREKLNHSSRKLHVLLKELESFRETK